MLIFMLFACIAFCMLSDLGGNKISYLIFGPSCPARWLPFPSAGLIMLSAKQCRHWYHLKDFGMTRPGIKPTTSSTNLRFCSEPVKVSE